MKTVPFTFPESGCLIKADRERKTIGKMKKKRRDTTDGNSENSNCRNIRIQ